jgi:hypothetical protein
MRNVRTLSPQHSVGIQDHDLETGSTMKRRRDRRAGVAGSRNDDRRGRCASLAKRSKRFCKEARRIVLERRSRAVEQFKQMLILATHRMQRCVEGKCVCTDRAETVAQRGVGEIRHEHCMRSFV